MQKKLAIIFFTQCVVVDAAERWIEKEREKNFINWKVDGMI